MSKLTDLISQVAASNPTLADDLVREVGVLSSRRPYGLNFERHLPETVQLPERKVRRGDKAVVRAPRDKCGENLDGVWIVTGFEGKGSQRSAKLALRGESADAETTTRLVSDLVVVAEFRDPIYPGLRSTGKVERGDDKPYHSVISGENYHVLEALSFAYKGKVDCIYIDPPYNSGARDWKYNNNFVDSEDDYRHSKWLAMMERRLKVATELLNQDDSVLIVTIDEKECLRLGLLLEQTFPDSKIQMVSSVIKPGGTSRTKEFSRVEEYLFFVFIGSAEVVRSGDNMLADAVAGNNGPSAPAESDFWEGMVRRGIGVVRNQRPKQFYPIYIDPESRRIVEAGDPLPANSNRGDVRDRNGLVAVWPIKDDLTEGFWGAPDVSVGMVSG